MINSHYTAFALRPMIYPVKKSLFILLFLSLPIYAEELEPIETTTETQLLEEPKTGYISDRIYVPLRGSPCPECRIINKGLVSGTQLTILGSRENWSLVTTPKGQEGWIRTQHISASPIARDILAIESKKVSELQEQNLILQQDANRSSLLISDLRKSLAEMQSERSKISQELANIKSLSANELAINEQNQVLIKHNHKLQEERDVLRSNLDDLRDNKRNESFLYGGFVAFLGAILTAIIPRIRPKKRLSEWH